jgi:hypothetical protein
VGVEDVDIVQPEALEALVAAGDEVFAAAAEAVRAGPHIPAGLAGDDEFIAMSLEVLLQDEAEILLGRAVGRPVIIGEVEMGHAAVEGAADDGAAGFEDILAAEVVPEAE